MRASRLVRDLMAPDAPGAVAERECRAAAAAQVAAEVAALYPYITAENAAEVIEWQAKRLREEEQRQLQQRRLDDMVRDAGRQAARRLRRPRSK